MATSAKRLLELRLASGTRDQKLASGVWRIWQGKNNNDIYVAPRSVAGAMKVSFHPNGYCYAGLTREEYSKRLLEDGRSAPPRREFFSWQRPPTPDNQLLWAIEIWFPPGPEFKFGEPLPKDTWMIEAPPKGKATIVSIGFSRIPKGEALIPANVRELGYSQLTTGEYVAVFARPVDFDYEALKLQIDQQLLLRSRARPLLAANDEQLLSMKQPRLLLINDPKVDGFLRIMDVAVTVRRT